MKLRLVCLTAALAAIWQPAATAQTSQQSWFGKTETGIAFDATKAPKAGPLEFPNRRLIPEHVVRRRPSPLTPRAPRPGVPALEHVRGDLSQPANTTPALAASPSRSWQAAGDSGFAPGDPDIAAGPEEVIGVLNSVIIRYSKSGQITNTVTLNDWFRPFLPKLCPFGTANCLLFDPMVSYDQIHGRFLIVAVSLDFSSRRSHWLISASKGATFSSGWTNWVMDATITSGIQTSTFIDYPKLGYDAEAVYVTGNTFNSINNFLYTKVRVLRKAQMYGPNPATELTFWETWGLRNRNGVEVSTLYPPRLRGRTAATYSSYYLVNTLDASNFATLWRVVNPAGNNPTLQQIQVNDLLFYDKPPRVPQDSGVPLDIGDSGVQKAILRDGYLYFAYNSGYRDEPITVTYARVNTRNGQLLSQTRWRGGNFFYPAFDVPASLGPQGHFPNILTVGTNTRNGSLTPLSIQGVKDGTYPYFEDRWGDYFGGAIDPQEGGLWVYGAYGSLQFSGFAGWGTWAAYYPPATLQRFEDVPPAQPFFHSINTIALWGLSVGCSTNRFCPDDLVTRGDMAAFVIRGIMDEDFTYPQTPYFADVQASHPQFKYIQKLRELGITAGCAVDRFCAGDSVTRGQAAVFLIRAKMRPLFGEAFTFPEVAYFADVPPENGFFRHIQKLRELGITAGCAADRFCGGDPLTRGQAATFLQRAFLN